jgi:hypothetical protein
MNTDASPILGAINSLKAEISAAQLDLDAKRRSLDVLEGIYGKILGGTEHKDGALIAAIQPIAPPSNNGEFNVDDLFADVPKRWTFTDETRRVVEKFGAKEFNISIVESAMKKLGITIKGKSPKSRISVSLNKLCDEEFLMRTFNGSGNVANKYRIKSTMTESEKEHFAALNEIHSLDELLNIESSEPESDLGK